MSKPPKSIEDILEGEITKFQTQAKKHKKQYRYTQTTILILMASSAILATLSTLIQPQWIFSILNIIATSTTIALSNWLEMRKSFELWKTELAVYHNLNDLKRQIQLQKITKTWNQTTTQNTINQIQSIIKTASSQWQQMQNNKFDKT